MALLDDMSRCPGTGCPARELCRRFPAPGERLPAPAVMTALYVSRAPDAAACDQFLERDAEVPHAA